MRGVFGAGSYANRKPKKEKINLPTDHIHLRGKRGGK